MPGEIAICFAAVTPFTIDIESMMGPVLGIQAAVCF